MTNRYLRSSAVLGVVGAASVTLVLAACSDDGGSDPAPNRDDAGVADSGSDSSDSPDSGDPNEGKPTLTIINDLTYVASNVRICFLANDTGENLGVADALAMTPVPNDPKGLATGTLARIGTPPSMYGKALKPVVFYTTSLNGFGLDAKTCPELLQNVEFASGGGTGQLLEGQDFDLGSTSKVGALQDGDTGVLLVTGCPTSAAPPTDYELGDDTLDPATKKASVCGPDYEIGAKSTLQTYFRTLDRTSASAGKNRVQYLFGSWVHYNSMQLAFGTDSVFPSIGYAGSDGGVGDVVWIPAPGAMPDGGTKPFTFEPVDGPLAPAPGVEVPSLAGAKIVSTTDDPAISGWNHDVATDLTFSGISALEDGKSYALISVGSVFVEDLIDNKPNPRYFHTLYVPAGK